MEASAKREIRSPKISPTHITQSGPDETSNEQLSVDLAPSCATLLRIWYLSAGFWNQLVGEWGRLRRKGDELWKQFSSEVLSTYCGFRCSFSNLLIRITWLYKAQCNRLAVLLNPYRHIKGPAKPSTSLYTSWSMDLPTRSQAMLLRNLK